MQTTHQYVFSVGTGSTPQISYCRWGGLRTWDKTDFTFFKYEWGDICNLWSLWALQLKPTLPKYSQSITKCFPSAQEAFKRQCSSPKSTTLFWYDANSYTLTFDTVPRIDTRRFKTNSSNNKNTGVHKYHYSLKLVFSISLVIQQLCKCCIFILFYFF